MKYLKYIMASTMASLAMVSLNAQTYNDTVRTHTWSVYGQGGVSYYHGMRGADVSDSRRPVSPDAAVGVKYNVKPWVRLGLNLEYTMLKATGKYVSSQKLVKEDFVITDPSTNKTYPTTLETTIDRIQNRYNMHYAMADLNVDFNIMDIWHHRKAQKFNMWLGVGVGYLHGWSRHSLTNSYRQEAIAKGEGYYNVYTHNYLTTDVHKEQVNALYIPASLSFEYDITSRWTVGLIGQYKYLPLDKELTPKGIVSGGLVIRYNFVGKRMPTNRALYYKALSEQAEMKEAYEQQLRDKQRSNEDLSDKLRQSQQENQDLKALVEDCQKNKGKLYSHEVYFPVNKTNITAQEKIRLDDFIASLKEQKGYKLTIIGEASSDGPSTKNFKLSEGRLNHVVDYLKKQGIEDFSIKLEKAVGDSNGCPDVKCRRVQITVE